MHIDGDHQTIKNMFGPNAVLISIMGYFKIYRREKSLEDNKWDLDYDRADYLRLCLFREVIFNFSCS